MADLDSIRQSINQPMADNGLGTLTGLANVIKNQMPNKADAGTAKIPLALLPPGTQPGQRISLTVTGIDGVAGMATVVPDAVQNAVAPAPVGNASAVKPDAVDKSITMGPMDAFRSFLFQQTQDQQENQQ
jgi:hypothetical protein